MGERPTMIHEDRAAEMLKMSRRKLRQLSQLEFIHHVPIGRSWYYPLAQVQHLAQLKNKSVLMDITLPERVEHLAAEVQRLRRTIRHLALATGMIHAFWTPSDTQLRGLYEMASKLIHSYGPNKKPTDTDVNEWLASISRLSDLEFWRLRRWFREDQHPWRPFWIVTEEMMRALGMQTSRQEEIEGAVLRHRLGLCLDSLRRGILIYCGIESPYADIRRTMAGAHAEFAGTIGDFELEQLQAEDGLISDPETATNNQLRRVLGTDPDLPEPLR